MTGSLRDLRPLRAAEVPARSLNGHGPQARTRRLDIQLLRAVAVSVVILNHLTGWPGGGFVGVDIFFVISGYLMTDLLLRQSATTGRVNMLDFYRRRIRRIVPAAMFVLVVTCIASYLIFRTARFKQTVLDSVWSALFASNVRFAELGSNYFTADRAPSPARHYWSLAVEEQFYLVLPILVIAALWLRRRSGRRIPVMGIVVVLVIGASLAWSIHDTVASPATAYYSTFTRADELGIGALVAVSATLHARIPALAKAVLGWIGVAGILASLALIDDATPFPGYAALLPTIATALLLICGMVRWAPGRTPLVNPVTTYVGDISYSLYLWHWPIIVLGGALYASGTIPFGIGVAICTLAASSWSYHAIENPVRHSAWLEPRGHQARPRMFTTVLADTWLVAGAVVCAVVAFAAVQTTRGEAFEPLPVAAVEATSAASPAASPAAPATPQDQLQLEIQAALAATTWPDLTPSLDDDLEATRAPEWVQDQCLDVTDSNADRCVYGPADATKQAVLLGDSVAISWLPGLRAALPDYRIHVLTLGQCPVNAVTVTTGGGAPRMECNAHREWAAARVADIQPDLIIASSAMTTVSSLASKATGAAALAELQNGLTDELNALAPHAGKTIVIGTAPNAKNLQDCATKTSAPKDCVSPLSGDTRLMWAADQGAAEAAGAVFLSPQPWFCAAGRCPGFVGNTPVRADSLHPTGPTQRDWARSSPPRWKPHSIRMNARDARRRRRVVRRLAFLVGARGRSPR